MRPSLFEVWGTSFPSYFVLLLSGFLFATTLGVLWARRIGQDPDVIVDLGLTALVWGVIGSRLLHVVADGYFWDYVHLCTNPSLVDWHLSKAECLKKVPGTFYGLFEVSGRDTATGIWDQAKGVCHPAESDCFAWAKFWAGGLTYYGGFVGALIAGWHVLKRDRFPFWRAADMAGMVVPVGLAFGRMGCLLAGCCFGIRSGSALAVSFPPFSPASEFQAKALDASGRHVLSGRHLASLPVHPTQLYESAASLAIAAFCCFYLHPRKRYDGQVFLAFVGLYAVARFLLEFLRSDDRGGLFGLSTSQLIGAALLVAAAALDRVRRRFGPLPPARAAEPPLTAAR